MRSTLVFVLSLITFALASPLPIPASGSVADAVAQRDVLFKFSGDPLAIHKRAAVPGPEPDAEFEPDSAPASTSEDESGDSIGACELECGQHRVEGARNEREALCSAQGLRATLRCAQCIDRTWPESSWEDSAMAEYQRIVGTCESEHQQIFRKEAY